MAYFCMWTQHHVSCQGTAVSLASCDFDSHGGCLHCRLVPAAQNLLDCPGQKVCPRRWPTSPLLPPFSCSYTVECHATWVNSSDLHRAELTVNRFRFGSSQEALWEPEAHQMNATSSKKGPDSQSAEPNSALTRTVATQPSRPHSEPLRGTCEQQ